MDLGFRANLKIGIKNIATMMIILFVMAVGFTLIAPIVLVEHTADYFTSISLGLMFISVGSLFTSFQMIYTKMSVEFGSTRKSNFISNQLLKLIASFLPIVVFFIIIYFAEFVWGLADHKILKVDIKPMLFVFFVFLCTLGELIGAIINRYSKAGKMIYIVFLSLLGGISGISFAITEFNINYFLMNMLKFNPIVALIYGVVTVIMTGISWLIVRKYVVN